MIDFETAQCKRIKRANTDWWINEKSMVGKNGMTYIAYYTDVGEIRVKEIDAKCSRTPSRDECICRLNCTYADEHNAPSVCVMENGTIVVAYTGHGANHTLTLRITERPYDLFSFGEEIVLHYDESVTYAQLSENIARDELWLFTRVRGVTREFRYSSDAGRSWSTPTTFLESDAGGLFYFDIRHQLVADHTRGVYEQWFFALYGHPRISKDHTVRSGIFDVDGNLLTMDGKKTNVNLYSGGKLDLHSLAKVYESPDGTTVRLCAVSPIAPYRVGVASFVLNAPDTITYYSATWRDGKWNLSAPIAKGGEFLSPVTMIDGSQTYVAACPITTVSARRACTRTIPHRPTPTVSILRALMAHIAFWKAIFHTTVAQPTNLSRCSAPELFTCFLDGTDLLTSDEIFYLTRVALLARESADIQKTIAIEN